MAQIAAPPVQVIGTASTPTPTDRPYKGTIALMVDATDVAFRERIPLQGGEPVTLLYPLLGGREPRVEHHRHRSGGPGGACRRTKHPVAA